MVIAVANGHGALAVAQTYSEPIHLPPTDVVMPGMKGTELTARLRTEKPETRILYMSGYPEEETSDADVAFL